LQHDDLLSAIGTTTFTVPPPDDDKSLRLSGATASRFDVVTGHRATKRTKVHLYVQGQDALSCRVVS